GVGGWSPAGQRGALRFGSGWLRAAEGPAPPAEVARALARALPEAGRTADGDVRGAALGLAATLLERPDGAELVGPCREVALAGFGDASAENRAPAARPAPHPGMDLPQHAPPPLH